MQYQIHDIAEKAGLDFHTSVLIIKGYFVTYLQNVT